MHVQPLDIGAALHLGEGAAQHRRYAEHMGDAVAFQHIGEAFCPGHLAIVA
jgi:hypothetical protein